MERVLETRRDSTVDRLRPAISYSHPVTFHYEIQNHTSRMQKLTRAVKVYRLTVLTLACVAAGIVIGLVSRKYAQNWTERQFMYVEMPGELYLRLLKLMIVPLLVSNVILSFGSMQGRLTSRLGKIASFLYLSSNLVAITVAIILALLVCPGARPTDNTTTGNNSNSESLIKFNEHHYFNDYHQSINRYREYHPMFYHTDRQVSKLGANREETLNRLVKRSATATPMRSSELLRGPIAQPQEAQIRIQPPALESSIEVNKNGNLDVPTPLAHQIASETLVMGRYQREHSDSSTSSSWFPDHQRQPTADNIQYSPRNGASLRTSSGQIVTGHRVGVNTKLPIDALLDVLRNLVPDSFVGATLHQVRTRLFAPKELIIGKNGSIEPPPSRWPMGHEICDQANIIGLLAMSVLTGVVLSHMEEASKPVLDLCASVSELSLRIGMMMINLTPFCIMFLLIGQIARARDLSSMAGELFKYSITVLLALLIHGFILLPLVYYFATKRSPLKFFIGMFEAIVASFATSSSSATMALMLNCLSDLELNPVIVGAFGPLGSVFNMNGTAIYEAIGAIFIAQTLGVTLPLTSLLLVGLSSAIASLSTAGIPSSGMMTMVIVLNAINLPVLPLSLIYIVDFIIDRFRTVVNVWSGAIVCAIINHIFPEHLFEEEMKPEKYRKMLKYRESRASLGARKSLGLVSDEHLKPQVISVTITPPLESSQV